MPPEVSTHSRPKAAGASLATCIRLLQVSTHSRPKAAGRLSLSLSRSVLCFNTQPPEGGWCAAVVAFALKPCFNTQPPEGGWSMPMTAAQNSEQFQHTAARRRLGHMRADLRLFCICFNTQPPEGGWLAEACIISLPFGFNTQPPEGGWFRPMRLFPARQSFNTQPPEGGWYRLWAMRGYSPVFQHTAARRRLDTSWADAESVLRVSTHSRPKAAGTGFLGHFGRDNVSTHSRPKAAGVSLTTGFSVYKLFQHTAARRRLGHAPNPTCRLSGFNTQPPEGGWGMGFRGHLHAPFVSTHSRPKAAGYRQRRSTAD